MTGRQGSVDSALLNAAALQLCYKDEDVSSKLSSLIEKWQSKHLTIKGAFSELNDLDIPGFNI